MASKGVVRAWAQCPFHFRTRRAGPRAFKERAAKPKAYAAQRKQIQSANDNIASQDGRVEGVEIAECRDHGYVFRLDEGHRASATASRVAISDESREFYFRPLQAEHRGVPRRAHADPPHVSGPGEARGQCCEGFQFTASSRESMNSQATA